MALASIWLSECGPTVVERCLEKTAASGGEDMRKMKKTREELTGMWRPCGVRVMRTNKVQLLV